MKIPETLAERPKREGGHAFTLIELLVVIAIIAILASLRGIQGAKGKKRRANAVFADTHVELRRDAPKRIFTLESD